MPRHFEDAKKAWEIFLNTVNGEETIKVSEVTPKQITFTMHTLESLREFKGLLANGEKLQSKVLHALGKDQIKATSTTLPYAGTAKITEGPKELMQKIFGKSFLVTVGVDESTLDKFIDNSDLQTATIKLEGTPLEIKRDMTEFEILQATINEKANLTKILHGEENFNVQMNVPSKLAQEVIKVDPTSTRSIIFNYGALLQAAQVQARDSEAPIIASISSTEFTLDKGSFLHYISSLFPSGMIFQPLSPLSEKGIGKVLPILFKDEGEEVSKDSPIFHKFNILLDISGSMATNFESYIVGFKNVIARITNEVAYWEITLTAFSDTVKQKVFSSINEHASDNIDIFIKTLKAEGSTDLHCPLHESLDSLKEVTDHSTLIIFTDGADNINKCTKADILGSASAVRKSNDQFAMYSIGYGTGYEESFFKTLAIEGGFTHMHLTDIGKLEQYFAQYIHNIDKARVLYKFLLSEGESFMEQVQAGEVAIGQMEIPLGTKISKGGTEYSIGTSTPPTISSYWSSISDYITGTISEAITYIPSVDVYALQTATAMLACQYAPQIIGLLGNYCSGMISNGTDSTTLMIDNNMS